VDELPQEYSMKYRVELALTEREILRDIVGKSISEVLVYHAYSVRLIVSERVIDFSPLEVSTSTAKFPLADVTRPLITADQSQLRKGLDWETILKPNETIREIQILNTIVTFSDTQDRDTVDAIAVDVGGKNRWYNKLHNPVGFKIYDPLDQVAYVSLDIGIAIFMFNEEVITISTDSLGYGVDAEIGGAISQKMLPYVTHEQI
jgi:hypothetical protein